MADANPKPDKREIVDNAYCDEFLAELASEFNFDALEPKMASEIRVVGWRYLVERAIDNDDGAMRRQTRWEYQALKKQINDFAELLLRPEYADIGIGYVLRSTEGRS